MANLCSGSITLSSTNEALLYAVQAFILADKSAFGIPEDELPSVFVGDYIVFQFETSWSGGEIFERFIRSIEGVLDSKSVSDEVWDEAVIEGEAREPGCLYHEQIRKAAGSPEIRRSMLYPSDISFIEAIRRSGVLDLAEGQQAILGQLVFCRCLENDGVAVGLQIEFQCQTINLRAEAGPSGRVLAYSDDNDCLLAEDSDYFGEMVDDLLSGEPIEVNGEKWW